MPSTLEVTAARVDPPSPAGYSGQMPPVPWLTLFRDSVSSVVSVFVLAFLTPRTRTQGKII
jgi:hypothetical protein